MTPTAVVVGGSVAGLAAALSLSGAGYRVLVFDRAAEPPDGPAAEVAGRWRRPTVPQGRHSHTLTSLGVRVLRERAPQVLAGVQEAGAAILDLTAALPPGAAPGEPGDEELVALACRRSTLEIVLHRIVRDRAGVAISHRAGVRGVTLDRTGGRVTGVRTADGRWTPTDVVVDATGRRAASRGWLADAGVPVAADLSAASGLRGFTRFYRLLGRRQPGPLNRGNAAGDIWDHYAGVLHPGDAGTFSVALAVLPDDPAMDGLRHPGAFDAAARATPGLGAWLADGVAEPISGVHPITVPPNTLRGTATGRQRPVAGLFPVGDAGCITNPLFGRGLSLALAHAYRLADLLRDAGPCSHAASRLAEELYRPWYEHSARADADRIARWRAAVTGGRAPAPAAFGGPTPAEVAAAARTDGSVWRGLTRLLMSLRTPAEVFDDEFVARVRRAGSAGTTGNRTPERVPEGPPGREDLVRLVAGACAAGRR